jgi:hypothetical protein
MIEFAETVNFTDDLGPFFFAEMAIIDFLPAVLLVWLLNIINSLYFLYNSIGALTNI